MQAVTGASWDWRAGGGQRRSPPACTRPPSQGQLGGSLARKQRAGHNLPRPQGIAQSASAGSATARGQTLSGDGRYSVRTLDKDDSCEIQAVCQLQTDAFSKAPSGVQLFQSLENLEKQMFKAEVLSQMRQKLRYSSDERFVLLVARATALSSSSGGASSSSIAGVVEVSWVADKQVLQYLRQIGWDQSQGAVPYLASMAVRGQERRQGVARLLLQAAEEVASQWGSHLFLHVYRDNDPAVRLYQDSGFDTVSEDAGIAAKLGLLRPRLLMVKNLL